MALPGQNDLSAQYRVLEAGVFFALNAGMGWAEYWARMGGSRRWDWARIRWAAYWAEVGVG